MRLRRRMQVPVSAAPSGASSEARERVPVRNPLGETGRDHRLIGEAGSIAPDPRPRDLACRTEHRRPAHPRSTQKPSLTEQVIAVEKAIVISARWLAEVQTGHAST